MYFTPVPVDEIGEPLRSKVRAIDELGGDSGFHRFAAHAPEIAEFYWGHFYRDVFFAGRLPVRLKELVRLRLAGLNGCPFCQAGDAASAKKHGISQEEIDAVFALRDDGFTPAERAALEAATRMANVEPYDLLTEQNKAALATHFDQAELVELTMVMAVLTGMGRMLAVAGFIERSCPVPAPAAEA
ncbi:MAG TPA: carboxymuconolactone decarboxylase family protein [Actinoplanes sp.]|nr:carboxymuconolactone decarboxylase family protein [Actinoplanes sp.]